MLSNQERQAKYYDRGARTLSDEKLTNQSKITRVHTTLLASMSRNAFSARALKKKNIFFDIDIVVKKHKNLRIEMWFIVVCTLKHFFRQYCFSMLSEFAKVFEKKV